MMTSARVPAALMYLLLLLLLLSSTPSTAQPGFLSLDCGGKTGDYTDEVGIHWTSDSGFISSGQTAALSPQTQQLQTQYRSLRYFPVDSRKYCYSLDVRQRARYLVRASFLYGSFDESPIYPKFGISLGAARWSTIEIDDPWAIEVEEAVLLTQTSKLSVCLSDAATGRPFISTLELRMFTGSLYATPYESEFFLGLSARVNFGAVSNDSIRYPDDPYDRIWRSDLTGRPLDFSGGGRRVSTERPIFVGTQEAPPQKVMQTAVVGQRKLTYEFISEKFPGNAWAAVYLAEIEDLAPNETRSFTINASDWLQYKDLTVDVAADAGGKYRLYEPTYDNVSVPRLFFLKLKKTNDSLNGPIINAVELYQYIRINADDGDLARRGRRKKIIIVACTASGALLLILVAVGCWYFFRRKKNPLPPAAPEKELGLIEFPVGPTRYTPSEIERATNGFERKIGSGGSANVYHGRLGDGTEIAAKRLNHSQHSISDFTNEVKLLSQLRHRNVVPLIGYSDQGEQNILVYEFMHNGTVKQHLPGGGSGLQITSWAQRLQIAADAARGMEYLHTGCSPAILHRDLKTSNILLDCNMRAKIADFGLSEQMVGGRRHSRGPRGTFGYVDPDHAGGQLSEKSDIYSFGVILLELISGHEVTHDGDHIVQWARAQMENENMEAIIDGSLDAGYKLQSVQMIFDLAVRCVSTQAERPSSSEVVREIEDAIRVELQVEAPQQTPLESGDSDDSQPLDPELVDLEQLYNEMIHRPSQPSSSSQQA